MTQRLEYLDSIRGIAALIVVFHHIFETFIKYNPDFYPVLVHLFETINLGRMGVIVFFITSGFVIPYSLKPDTPNGLKIFIIKRFFRLYPAYWFSIVSALVIGIGVGINIISVDQVLINFTMIQKFLGFESVIESYWTLHLELVFYIICGLLFSLGLIHKSQYHMLLSVIFCLCAVGFAALKYYKFMKVPIIMPLGISVMFFGALLRSYFIDKQTGLRNPLIILAVFYLICLVVATKIYYQDGWLKWFSSHIVAFLLFFAFITKVKLRHKFFVYIGRISYSLYLLHSLIIGVVFYLLGDFSYTSLGFYCVMILVLLISVFVADISYRIIENPSVALAKKFTAKYRKIEINKANYGI